MKSISILLTGPQTASRGPRYAGATASLTATKAPFGGLLLRSCIFATIVFGQAQTASTPPKSDWANLRMLTAGAEIRAVSTGQQAIRGSFVGVNDDTLTIGQPQRERMVARSMVISVSLKKKNHRIRHILIGLGVGAAGGLAAGAGLDSAYPCRYMDLGCLPEANVGRWPSAKELVTPIGAVLGLAVGALLPAGGWREIYRSR